MTETPRGSPANLNCVKVEPTNANAIIALKLNKLLNSKLIFTDLF